jgi:hypothetical protein
MNRAHEFLENSQAGSKGHSMGFKIRHWLRRFVPANWSGWPQRAYLRPHYLERLQVVQQHLAECLDQAPPGPLRIVSLCAGDGRDVIGVLQAHGRRSEVEAYLVELNGQSVADGARQAAAAGLEKVVHFIHTDATDYSNYKNLVPCDIVLVCGVWGHVPVNDRTKLIRALASFCKPGATVIWTRSISKGTLRVQEVQSQFDGSSWSPVRLSTTSDEKWAVGTYRFRGPSLELPSGGRIFNFRKKAG